MDRIRVGQLEFKCAIHGAEGPLVVMLHGFGGGPLDWHNAIPTLAKHHQLVIPNLTPLFSSNAPLAFSKQVEVLSGLINQVNRAREEFVLVGASYGATLSWGVRAHFQSHISGHILINPMPLDPLSALKSAQLRMLFGLNMVPGALPLFLKTKMGRDLIHELGGVFGFGGEGRKGLRGLSEKKIALISKAVQRFAWISQHEDWAYWSNQLRDHVIPSLIVTGSQDPLFTEKDFRSYQMILPLSEHFPIASAEHMMSRTHGPLVGEIIAKFISSLSDESELDLSTLRHAI